MKIKHKGWIIKYFISLFFVLFFNSYCLAGSASIDNIVNKFLGGVEVVRSTEISSKKVYTGDLNGDKVDDILIEYVVPSRTMGQYDNFCFVLLALFVSDENSPTKFNLVLDKEIGGRTAINIKNVKFSKNSLLINALDYAEGDPNCCPSKKLNISCKYSEGSLVCSPRIFSE